MTVNQEAQRDRQWGARHAAIVVLFLAVVFGASDVTRAIPAAASAGPRTPDVDIEVTASSDAAGALARGDRLSYTVEMINVGTETATNVVLSDAVPVDVRVTSLPPAMAGGVCSVTSSAGDTGPGRWSVECRRGSLAPGRSAQVTFDALVTAASACGPLRNVVEARAANEGLVNVDGGNRVTTVDEVACAASIRLTSIAPASAHADERLIYRYFAENDGDVALRHVAVRNEGCDSRPALVDDGNGNRELAPGEIWVFRCTRVVRERDDDPLGSTAAVTARTATGLRVRDVVDNMTDVLHPMIELTQTVRPSSGEPGTRVTYRYVVNNTGDTPLLDVRVHDDVLGAIGTVDRLAVGAHTTLTKTMQLPADRVLVRADGRARARDATGLVVTATDHATVTVVRSEEPGPGNGPAGPGPTFPPPTAFTGFDAAGAARVMWILGAIGAALLAVSMRRRLPPPCHWRSL